MSCGNGASEHQAQSQEKSRSAFNIVPHPVFGGDHDPNKVGHLCAKALHCAGVYVFPFPLKAGPGAEIAP